MNSYLVLYNRYSYWIIIYCYYFFKDVSRFLNHKHKVNKYNKKIIIIIKCHKNSVFKIFNIAKALFHVH